MSARLVVVLAVAAIAAAYGATGLHRPDARPANAPPAAFSAVRALAQVKAIAQRPHPAGSPAMAAVARHLGAELRRLGLEVRPVVVRDPRTGVLLRIVAARLRGRRSTGAVLLVAHPDSVPYGPGAGDNATGVSVLLEIARALRSQARPRNDVIFLFDDGEELGTYAGGELFAERHPWMHDVRLVLGLDTAAWGVPFVMQDSPHNGTLVSGYATGAVHPLALGFNAATNREDDAEIDPFRRRGVPGLELEDTFAAVKQHTAADTVDRIDPRSLQSMGDQVLGAVRAYTGADLRQASRADRAFFTLPLIGVVHYPAAWSLPIGILAILLVVAAAQLARRRGLTFGIAGRGFLTAAGLTTGAAVLAKLAAAAYEQAEPDPRAHPLGEYLLPSSAPFALACLVLIVALVALACRRSTRRRGTLELGFGFLLLWLTLAALALMVTPVGAYLFQWPLIVLATAWLWILWRPGRSGIALAWPLAIAIAFFVPQGTLALFGDGVAGLPGLAVLTTLLCTLAALAVTAPEPATAPDRAQMAGPLQAASYGSARVHA